MEFCHPDHKIVTTSVHKILSSGIRGEGVGGLGVQGGGIKGWVQKW